MYSYLYMVKSCSKRGRGQKESLGGPTRRENRPRTYSAPSFNSIGNSARGFVAGPNTTLPLAAASNRDPWHGQINSCVSGDQPFTSHPV